MGDSLRSSLVKLAATVPAAMLAMLISIPSALAAQDVDGRVLDAKTGQSIGAASVTLLSEEGEPLRSTLTDSAGVFTLDAPQSGRYLLRARRIGYEEVTSSPFDLLPNETLAVELRIGVEAIALEPLTVTSEREVLIVDDRLERWGYYERQRMLGDTGFGYFLDPEDIQRHNPFHISEVLRTVPGVRITARGGRRTVIGGRGGCTRLAYFLNGHLIGKVPPEISPRSLVAMEVYPGFVGPAEFGNGAGCFVMLWTGVPPIGAR